MDALAGDANRDRAVDMSDLSILATNWRGTGKTFSHGEFNYDGIVNIFDLAILATNWQTNLPAPLAAGTLGKRMCARFANPVAPLISVVG